VAKLIVLRSHIARGIWICGHIRDNVRCNLNARGKNGTNLIRVVRHESKGPDTQVMKNLYRQLIVPQINWVP
jgi:hypothetical protein